MNHRKKDNQTGGKWTRGKGVGSELRICIWNQAGVMDWCNVVVDIMRNCTISRRCCTSLLGSRQLTKGRQSGPVELKLQTSGVNISKTKSKYH